MQDLNTSNSADFRVSNGKLYLRMDLEPDTFDFDINVPGFQVNGSLIIEKVEGGVKDKEDDVHNIEVEDDTSDIERDIGTEDDTSDIEKELLDDEKNDLKETIPGTVVRVKQDNSFFRSIADQIYEDERWCLVIRHVCYHYLQNKFESTCFLRKFAFDEEVLNCDLECGALSTIYHLKIVILNSKREVIECFGDATWNPIYIIKKKNGIYNSLNTDWCVPVSDVFTTEYRPGCFENHVLRSLNIDVVLPHTTEYPENNGANAKLIEDGSEAIIMDSIYATRNMLPIKSSKKKTSTFYYKLRFIDGTERWYSRRKVEINTQRSINFISKKGRKSIPTDFYRPQTTI